MLIQGSTGSGKSYLLRVLAEQILPHTPVIILDREGEFATLREKYDVVLVGPDGELPCSVETAAVVARSLLETGVSAVVDLYELKAADRQEYVKRFLTAMVEDLPKPAWPSMKNRATVVIVDEAHLVCPQQSRSVAAPSVIDLMTRGRKRGVVGILATQRISKLHNDAAAECGNVVVGRCAESDSARACEQLGVGKSMRPKLQRMRRATWRASGPAFEDCADEGDITFQGAKAKTTHVKSGKKALKPPAPSEKIKRIAKKLAKVQETTEKDAKDLSTATTRIKVLERELRQKPKAASSSEDTQHAVKRALEKYQREQTKKEKARLRNSIAILNSLRKLQRTATGTLENLNKNVDAELRKMSDLVTADQAASIPELAEFLSDIGQTRRGAGPQPNMSNGLDLGKPPAVTGPVSPIDLPASQQKILNSLAWWVTVGQQTPAKTIVAAIAGVSFKSSGYKNNVSALRTAGLVEYPQHGHLILTTNGRKAAQFPEGPGSLDDLHLAWQPHLTSSQWNILYHVIEKHPATWTKEELAEAAGVSFRSSGYKNNLSRLRTFKLITPGGMIGATDLLFPEGLV
jgi:hypothetical protein